MWKVRDKKLNILERNVIQWDVVPKSAKSIGRGPAWKINLIVLYFSITVCVVA